MLLHIAKVLRITIGDLEQMSIIKNKILQSSLLKQFSVID